ncbi:hypothetical protein BD560DRAFT_328383, partial [Blakeslea trispora]
IFRSSLSSSTKVMLHLNNLPHTQGRKDIIQAKHALRLLKFYNNTLLNKLFPFHQQFSKYTQWRWLHKSTCWQRYFFFSFIVLRNGYSSMQLPVCCSALTMDPILWLPMTNQEPSGLIRWCLGLLSWPSPHPYSLYSGQVFNTNYAANCIDSLFFLLNILLTKRLRFSPRSSPWKIHWPVICQYMHNIE